MKIYHHILHYKREIVEINGNKYQLYSTNHAFPCKFCCFHTTCGADNPAVCLKYHTKESDKKGIEFYIKTIKDSLEDKDFMIDV